MARKVRFGCPVRYIKSNVYNPSVVRYIRDHFREKTEEREITIWEVDAALLSCECIESYHRTGQKDRFLLLGWYGEPPEPLHVVVEVVRQDLFTFIDVQTVYRPSKDLWSVDYRKRLKVA